jgi:hypothetical protein
VIINLPAGPGLPRNLRAPAGGNIDTPEFRRGEVLSAKKLNEISKSINMIFGGVDPAQQGKGRNNLLERTITWLQGANTDETSMDMPDNGKSFEAVVAHPERDLKVERLYCYSTAGTYSCQLKIDGTLVGPAFTQSSTFPVYPPLPLLIGKGKKITIYVSTSSGVSNFQGTVVLMPA